MERNLPIPNPSDIAFLETTEGQLTYIATNVDAYRRDTRAVRKMLSIPAWLAKEADAKNISFSKVLHEALKEKLLVVK